jgi:predicted phosphodiesterase
MEQEIDAWSLSQLSEEERAYLRTFKPTIELRIGRKTLLCYHGSPRSYNEQILPTTSEEELGAILGNQTADIFAGGHTHNQMFRRFRDKIVLNPGSVGRALETLPEGRARNPPWAEYAIIETDETESPETDSVRLLRVGVDSAAVREGILNSGMPHARWRVKDMD